jgi:hypothetical protein
MLSHRQATTATDSPRAGRRGARQDEQVTSPWRFDDALAEAVVAAAGTSLDASVDQIGTAMLRWIPTGSTAKVAAVAAGELPPGLDPTAVAEQVLDGSPHSWTCWPAATITAAVLHGADVVAELRTDPESPPIDVHAAVVVDRQWHVDPCLGPGVGLDLRSGDTRSGPSAIAEVVPVEDGTFRHLVRGPRFRLHYVSLNPAVTRRDLHALLELSVTHTGVRTDRRFWQLGLADGMVGITEPDGVPTRRRWRREGEAWVLLEHLEGDFDELVAGATGPPDPAESVS